MLQSWTEPARLAAALPACGAWHPYPTASERAGWQALGPGVLEQLIANGTAAQAEPWPLLPATLFLEFARNGNRSRFQGPNFARRHKLQRLVLGACAAGDGRFIDDVVDGVWLLCEESTWCLPAHLYLQKQGPGLPDTSAPAVDLFAGETANLLSWTLYLLEPQLAAVSPLIPERLRRELQFRILTPCLERSDFWWIALGGSKHVNNWNPWCNSNWLTTILLHEPDPARRLAAISKSLRSLEAFVASYLPDGGCDEGPSYWNRAAASLFDCLELMYEATQGACDCYREPLIGAMGRFIYRAQVADEWFLNFADAPARMLPDASLIFRYGQRLGDSAMMGFAAWVNQRKGADKIHLSESLGRALPGLFTLSALRATPPAPALPRTVWLPDNQIFLARAQSGSSQGLTLAAKGGHNGESHNHNDVGHFVLYQDGQPVLIDAGVGEYTAKTFSKDRYTIWSMQSQYHNLPTINGEQQPPGRQYAATVRDFADDEAGARLELDLAGAWPASLGLKSWRRQWQYERRGRVALWDRWELAAAPSELFLGLLTCCGVQPAGPGQVLLTPRELPGGRATGSLRLRWPEELLDLTLETIPVADGLERTWGATLTRLRLNLRQPSASGEWHLEFLPV